MKPGTTPNQRDLYLAPFKFADANLEKVRPVLILTNADHNRRWSDIIGMGLTSNLQTPIDGLIIDQASMEEGILRRTSKIVPTRIYSIAKDRLGPYIGRLKEDQFQEALKQLLKAFS